MRRYLIEVIAGKKCRFKDKMVLIILSLLELVYICLLTVKNFLFKINIIQSYKLPCKVISIGNITTGGTGKTPVVERLAHRLQKRKKKIAIVSRGYGGKNKKPLIISDGKQIFAGVKEAGDEVYMMARHLKNIPIIIGKDRYQAGKLAIKEFDPDIIILDDAFQHRQLERNNDIVTISAINPFGYNHLIPRGLLREPLSALKRADNFVISRADQVSKKQVQEIKNKLKRYNKNAKIFTSHYQPLYIKSLTSEASDSYKVDELKGKKVLALSGIGTPDSFIKSLKQLEAKVIDSIIYPDHYKYREKDLMDIAVKAQMQNVDWVITTEKDAVKFTEEMVTQFRKLKIGIFTLGVKLEVYENEGLVSVIA